MSDNLVERLRTDNPRRLTDEQIEAAFEKAANVITELEASLEACFENRKVLGVAAARYRDAITRHKAQQDQYPLTTTHWDRELYDVLGEDTDNV